MLRHVPDDWSIQDHVWQQFMHYKIVNNWKVHMHLFILFESYYETVFTNYLQLSKILAYHVNLKTTQLLLLASTFLCFKTPFSQRFFPLLFLCSLIKLLLTLQIPSHLFDTLQVFFYDSYFFYFRYFLLLVHFKILGLKR